MKSNLFRFVLLTPIGFWIYLVFLGDLGADPAKALNHRTGSMALYYLLGNLLLGILISFKLKWPSWSKFLLQNRRFLGLVAFSFLTFHFLLYLVMESFEFKAYEQLVTKTYLIFSLSAFLILLILAATSNDFSIRKLGQKNWRRLHRTVYLASALFSVHIMLIEKTDLVKFGALLGVLWLLQILRFFRAVAARKMNMALLRRKL